MSDTDEETKHSHKAHAKGKNNHASITYFLGFIGALIFYIQQADGFWRIIAAFLKAMVWPAYVVYDTLKFIT